LGGTHYVDIALRHVGNCDAIELVAPHVIRRPAKVTGSVLDGAAVLVEYQSAPREKIG
jgi:hypothetical protein